MEMEEGKWKGGKGKEKKRWLKRSYTSQKTLEHFAE